MTVRNLCPFRSTSTVYGPGRLDNAKRGPKFAARTEPFIEMMRSPLCSLPAAGPSVATEDTVQVFPFIGRGGIYFGVLNGTTSRRVPTIANGVFSPVLELGVALAVGLGKEVSIGPLSGGIYVEAEVIFEGVLAWFHPSSPSVREARYYRAQGIAALHGKLYGEVDFAVLKASVSIEAYAQVSVVFEAL